MAQLPVSTIPENRNVVLEEFTGIHCTWCPDGHLVAATIKAANPNDFFIVNIHEGSFQLHKLESLISELQKVMLLVN